MARPFVFRQLFDHTSFTFTYILGCPKTRQAIIIDPVSERIPLYTRLFKELDLKLVKCVDTHVHADHISANGALRDAFSCAIIMPKQSPLQDVVSIRIDDGDEIEVSEDLKLKAIYTPGHTSDSYTYYVGPNVIPGCASGALFTGDTLFIRGTGRTDFQHGSAAQLYDSLFDRLLTYPADTWVYPGHDYKGESISSIGEEAAHNPRILIGKDQGKDAFIDHMNNLKLANPKMMDVAVPANLKLGLPCSKLQQEVRERGSAYSAQQAVAEVVKDKVAVVDLRDDNEVIKYGTIQASHHFHIPYAKLLQPNGVEEIAQLAKNYDEVILYCSLGERSSLALNKSREVGVENIKHIEGGFAAWHDMKEENSK